MVFSISGIFIMSYGGPINKLDKLYEGTDSFLQNRLKSKPRNILLGVKFIHCQSVYVEDTEYVDNSDELLTVPNLPNYRKYI